MNKCSIYEKSVILLNYKSIESKVGWNIKSESVDIELNGQFKYCKEGKAFNPLKSFNLPKYTLNWIRLLHPVPKSLKDSILQ